MTYKKKALRDKKELNTSGIAILKELQLRVVLENIGKKKKRSFDIRKEEFKTHYEKKGYKVDADGRLLHRVVSERVDGIIPKGWHVHHCDYNKVNNSIHNLVQIPPGLHETIHRVSDPRNPPSKELILGKLLPEYVEKERVRNLSIFMKSDDQCKDLAREICKQLGYRNDYEKAKLLAKITEIINN